ncbi:MAG TPA: hypothetical protein VN626_01385, partial [Clostridia bacterium]|nr:hypothetical protein [Clostridia bacterium]
ILQETPRLLAIGNVRPILVISVIAAIAMIEGEFAGGLFGLFGGVLCDTAAFHIFGVAPIFFLVLGCSCGLLVIYLIQPNAKTAFLLCGGFALIYGVIAHYLIYGLWGYAGANRLLLTKTLPSAVYTAVFGMVAFLLVRWIHDRFEEKIME